MRESDIRPGNCCDGARTNLGNAARNGANGLHVVLVVSIPLGLCVLPFVLSFGWSFITSYHKDESFGRA